MQTAIYIILTLVKAGAIFYFVARIIKALSKNETDAKLKALIQFFLMCGFLIVVSAIEFGIAFLIQGDG